MTRQDAIIELKWRKTKLRPLIDKEEWQAINMAIEALSVEVVRCKDCRWFDKGDNEVDSWEYCTRLGHHPQSGGFCAWGERREP